MPVILQQKNLFVALEDDLLKNSLKSAPAVRRPLYGMQIKEPMFAWMGVYQDLGGDGSGSTPISLVDSSSPGGYSSGSGNHNFILQDVTEQRQERVQVIETFGDHFAFFYGEKPIVLQVRGMLFNTEDFNWKNEFLANYNRFLRGTKCVENKSRVFLGWDDVIAQGYLLNASVTYSKDMPNVVPVGFSMLLTKPPLDLSGAIGAIDNPDTNSGEPTTYRTLSDGSLVEYLSSSGGVALKAFPFYGVGTDGVSKSSGNDPVEVGLTDVTSDKHREYLREEAALQDLLQSAVAEEQAVDVATASIALATGAMASALGALSPSTAAVAGAFEAGVANSATVVPTSTKAT